jgi:hypothetical protein
MFLYYVIYRLEKSILGRHVYSKGPYLLIIINKRNSVLNGIGMGGNLKALVLRHAASFSKFPDHPIGLALPKTLALKSPTIEQFDASFTRIVGGASPPFPFATAHDYYAWASSHKFLGQVRVPFLAINAKDDPVVREAPKGAGGNGWVSIVLTPSGGHLGWFTVEAGEMKRWFRRPVLEWLRAVGEDLVHNGQRGRPLFEKDGLLTEVGREGLGCKEFDDGLIVVTRDNGDLLRGL